MRETAKSSLMTDRPCPTRGVRVCKAIDSSDENQLLGSSYRQKERFNSQRMLQAIFN